MVRVVGNSGALSGDERLGSFTLSLCRFGVDVYRGC